MINIPILIIVAILFSVLISWTWNNTKDLKETEVRIKFILGAMVILTIITLTIFCISKIGIKYPNKEMAKNVKTIVLLFFIPINGLISIPHIAKILAQMNSDNVDDEKIKKKIIIIAIVVFVALLFEIFYLKSFQKGIISIINNKQR